MRLATDGPGGASRGDTVLVRLPLIPRRLFLAPAFLALALVAGCVGLPGGPGKTGAAEETGALAAEAIAVTPLDAPAAPPAAAKTAASAAAAETAAPAAAAETETAAEVEAAAAGSEAVDATGAAAESPAKETPPPPPKSPEQLACERKGGTWSSAGGSGIKACVRRTRDGGKQCVNGTQCEGDCLARSQSCSPIAPLFGCNEILQDNGARVTQCIE